MDSARLVDQRGTVWTVHVPTSRRERIRGLRGHPPLGPHQGLLLKRTRSVHTFGMRFPISVVLLDGDLNVIRTTPMRPGRLLWPRRGVRHVLECREDADLRPGDRLVVA